MFIFTWSIENFSMQGENEFIRSPAFRIEKNDKEKRQLVLYPYRKSYLAGNVVKCYLVPDIQSRAYVKLAIISKQPSKTKVSEFNIKKNAKKKSNKPEVECVLERNELLKKDNLFLPSDTLTIELNVECLHDDLLHVRTNQFAKTNIDIECHIFEVNKNMLHKKETGPFKNVQQYSKTINTQSNLLSSDVFKINFCHYSDQNRILISIEKSKGYISDIICSRCKILFGNKEIELENHVHLFFGNSKNNYDISVIMNEEEISWFESNSFFVRLDFSNTIVTHKTHVVEFPQTNRNCNLPCLKPNNSTYFESIYRNNKFCDVVFKTPGIEFLAHKCVLAASSSWFNTIFENSSNKKLTMIEINNFDIHIVDKMLLFVYTRTVENLEFDDIINLYSAAIKFQIPDLVKICSINILENLSVKNICQVLELAIMYQDYKMVEVSRNFIFSNHKEIFTSTSWKNLMKKQSKLTTDIMLYFCTNLHSCVSYNSMDDYVSSALEANERSLKSYKLSGDIPNETESNSFKFFKSIYVNKKFCDIIFKVGNIKFFAHKFILGTFSTVFEAMFESITEEKENNILNIYNVDEDTMSKMLFFMYTKTVENINTATAEKLYSAADQYQILELKEECSRFILSNLTVENACEILKLANLYRDQEMGNVVLNFIQNNHAQVFGSENE